MPHTHIQIFLQVHVANREYISTQLPTYPDGSMFHNLAFHGFAVGLGLSTLRLCFPRAQFRFLYGSRVAKGGIFRRCLVSSSSAEVVLR